MNILFIVDRNLYYKFFSTIIKEALQESHSVFVLHAYQSNKNRFNKNIKSEYFPNLNQAPFLNHKNFMACVYNSHQDITNFIEFNKIEAVFSLNPRLFYNIKKIKTKWYLLQHGIDSFVSNINDCDAFFSYSSHWLLKKYTCNTVYTGIYYIDKNIFNINKILTKYNLNKHKKIILYLPIPNIKLLKWNQYTQVYFKFVYKEERILKVLKQFCNKHDYQLVIKSRLKDRLKSYFHDYGHVFYDELYYPATIHDFLFASDIVIGNLYSTTIVEALSFKCKYLDIKYDKFSQTIKQGYSWYFPSNTEMENLIEPTNLQYSCDYFDFSVKTLEKIRQSNLDDELLNQYHNKFCFQKEMITGAKKIIKYISEH